MKDYYSLFVELSLNQCMKGDYADKLKVKKHNMVTEKLKLLQAEIKQNYSEQMFHMLLSHEDERVKINAASLCLQMNVLVDQSVVVLEKMIENSEDPTICFSAKMILQGVRK